MPNEVKVTRITEERTLDASGRPVRQHRVEWMCGSHGPFVLYVADAFADPHALKAELDRRAQQLAVITGPEY